MATEFPPKHIPYREDHLKDRGKAPEATELSGLNELLSFSEAAKTLGVYRTTITDLVECLGIMPKVIAANGKAKGLDRADMVLIRSVLRPGKRRGSARVAMSRSA